MVIGSSRRAPSCVLLSVRLCSKLERIEGDKDQENGRDQLVKAACQSNPASGTKELSLQTPSHRNSRCKNVYLGKANPEQIFYIKKIKGRIPFV